MPEPVRVLAYPVIKARAAVAVPAIGLRAAIARSRARTILVRIEDFLGGRVKARASKELVEFRGSQNLIDESRIRNRVEETGLDLGSLVRMIAGVKPAIIGTRGVLAANLGRIEIDKRKAMGRCQCIGKCIGPRQAEILRDALVKLRPRRATLGAPQSQPRP